MTTPGATGRASPSIMVLSAAADVSSRQIEPKVGGHAACSAAPSLWVGRDAGGISNDGKILCERVEIAGRGGGGGWRWRVRGGGGGETAAVHAPSIPRF